ncbi:hypothetical protein ACC711_39245, partial [Rhizobium ruizarguesonis]
LAQEVLVAFDVAQEGWAAAVLVAAATLVPVVAAASYAAVRPATPPTPEGAAPERPAPERPASAGLRTAADLGAAATVAVVAWGTAPALAWMV